MLLKIILRLSLLTLCVIPITSYAGWFEVDKIPSALNTWLLDVIKDNPGSVITIAICFVLAYLWHNRK
jgi:hypothetical protein